MGRFPLAKWESNIQTLNNDTEKSDTKLLGFNWNKNRDTYLVDVSSQVPENFTQRTMFKKLASIYYAIGLISPILMDRKHLFHQAVDKKRLGW